VIVDQVGEGRFEGILPHIPGGAPGQLIVGNVGDMGHLLQAEITGVGQDTGIEMGQEGGPQGISAGRMDKVIGKVGPAIDLDEQIAEFDTLQPLGKARGQGVRRGRTGSASPRCILDTRVSDRPARWLPVGYRTPSTRNSHRHSETARLCETGTDSTWHPAYWLRLSHSLYHRYGSRRDAHRATQRGFE
jgi:hypothetical protein